MIFQLTNINQTKASLKNIGTEKRSTQISK